MPVTGSIEGGLAFVSPVESKPVAFELACCTFCKFCTLAAALAPSMPDIVCGDADSKTPPALERGGEDIEPLATVSSAPATDDPLDGTDVPAASTWENDGVAETIDDNNKAFLKKFVKFVFINFITPS